MTTYAAESDALAGTWVRRGLVWFHRPGPSRQEIEDAMYTDEEARRARTAWLRGDRSEWVVTGKRVYFRRAKRGANPPKVRGSERKSDGALCENRSAPDRCANTTSGADPHLRSRTTKGG